MAVRIGNLRVVDAIRDARVIDDGAGELGAELPGIVSGHDLAGAGAWAAVGAAVLLAVVLLVRGHITRTAAAGAVVLSLVIPPWIIPGAGAMVVVVARCLARRRGFASPTAGGAAPPGPVLPAPT